MQEDLNVKLVTYITRAIAAGSSETQIKRNLAVVGWGEEEINLAYQQGLINRGIPSPRGEMPMTNEEGEAAEKKDRKSTAGETALNLLSFGLLAIVATATGTLFYQVINKFFPDALTIDKVSSYGGSYFSTSTIHYATAVLVIAFPVYYVVMYLWFKGFRNNPKKTETDLTKVLTYLVLLITAVTILGNLIATVYTFLQGELSIRFVLKALIVLVLAGLIFGFYYLERKKIQHKKDIRRDFFKVFGLTATALVVSGIIFGFLATGSPAMERLRGFDNQREKDLSTIASCIERYSNEYKRLPNTLGELGKGGNYTYCSTKKDPVSGENYEYNILDTSRQSGINKEGLFELCAVFNLDSEESANSSKGYYSGDKTKWSKHSVGRSCTEATVVIRNDRP